MAVFLFLLPALVRSVTTDSNTQFYPHTDFFPSLDFEVYLNLSAGYPAVYLDAVGNPRTPTYMPIGGSHPSCTTTTTGTFPHRTALTDTCSQFIISDSNCGTTTFGNASSCSWVCQQAQGTGDAWFCGCNTNDALNVCANGGSCVLLEDDPSAGVSGFNVNDNPVDTTTANTLISINRRPGYCSCAAGFMHFTRSDTLLASGDQLILADCSRITPSSATSMCGAGAVPTWLYFPPALNPGWVFNVNLWQTCFPSDRGQPGCGQDVLPCLCPVGTFGDVCQYNVWNISFCSYVDGPNPTPANFTTADLCSGRGTCAFDGQLQSTKSAAIDPATVYCTSCDANFFGHQCRVTCGATGGSSITGPLCPDHSTCTANGTWADPQPYCACDSGYIDPRYSPSNVTDINGQCQTCTNELGTAIPTCNSQGTCPLSTWTCFNKGCLGLTNVPASPLLCTCNAGYVDTGCSIPRTQNFTCGAQSLRVSCVFQQLVDGIADYRHKCTVNTILTTGTSPSESYPLSMTCGLMSLIDQTYLNSTGLLRMLTGNTACAAILEQCGGQNTVCPVPFRRADLVTVPNTFFCDRPPARNYLAATVYGVTKFCWLVASSPDEFLCQHAPGSLFLLNCSLAVNWNSYNQQPQRLARTMLQTCQL